MGIDLGLESNLWLDEKNWAIWSMSMKDFLTLHGVNVALENPDTAVPEMHKKAAAYIRNSVAYKFRLQLTKYERANEVWSAMEKLIRPNTETRLYELDLQIRDLRKKDSESIADFFARCYQTRDELRAAGGTFDEGQFRRAILMGLPREFQLTRALLLKSDEKDLNKMEQLLLEQEHTNRHDMLLDSSAFTGAVVGAQQHGSAASGVECFYCFTHGHIKKDCGVRISDEQAGIYRRNIRQPASSSSSGGGGSSGGGWHGGGGGGSGGGSSSSGGGGSYGGGYSGGYGSSGSRGGGRRGGRGWFGFRGGGKGGGSGNQRPGKQAVLVAQPVFSECVAVANWNSSDSYPDVVIIDSGCFCHLTSQRELLHDFSSSSSVASIEWGNGARSPVKGIGTLRLESSTGYIVHLENTLYVPDSSLTLLSVIQVMDAGAELHFANGNVEISYNGDVLLTGSKQCRAIIADAQLQVACSSCSSRGYAAGISGGAWSSLDYDLGKCAYGSNSASSGSLGSALLWHWRYGHRGFRAMSDMARHGMVKGMDASQEEFEAAQRGSFCETCVTAKQPRFPYPAGGEKVKNALELLHTDVCGPLPVEGFGGGRYVLTVFDEATALSVVRIISNKWNVAEELVGIIELLENQHPDGGKVKGLQSDRGGEYISQEVVCYLRRRGIMPYKSAPYSPQQNGSAERLNRTLLESTRALLQDSGMPAKYWPEALVMANALRNAAPVAGRNKTPRELFYGIKPDVSMFRVFGCEAFVHVPSQQRNKLEPVSRKGTFVGYERGSDAWRVLVDGRIVVSRNVTFNERKRGPAALQQNGIAEEDATLHGAGIMLRDFEAAAELPPQPVEVQQQQVEQPAADPGEAPEVHEMGEQQAGIAGEDEEPAELQEAAEPAAAEMPDAGDGEQVELLDPASRRNRGVAPKRYSPPPFRVARPIWYDHINQLAAAAAVEAAKSIAARKVGSADPTTYEQAIVAPDATEWIQAMNEEMASLAANGTMRLEKPPSHITPIGVRWVYKRKYNANGSIERYKARLVAKGYSQREGIDYTEVYAPTGRMVTLRVLLSRAAAEDLELHQLDVCTAFLNGELAETVYVDQPQGYSNGDDSMKCRLLKALYGLKQAPLAWHDKLKSELEKLGFKQSAADPALFLRDDMGGEIDLLMHVDDLLLAAPNVTTMKQVKLEIGQCFDVRDLGEASYYLGMEIRRNRSMRELTLTQERMAREEVKFKYCPTDSMVADVLTKPVVESKFVKFRQMMGIT
ncbi:hypothetical protein Agub_g13600 [Astrephomene gubernaculifera]|uniref:Uncharacterized protein n=1 Tax=Astrephomene gubernaculifera TaxID=47775 RepID=A0AAD3E035_9CHLO|nr:hypothetical protein Agub_g13600 [Astrephomene gubernaculifera]